MAIWVAILLGVIQGIFMFFPVSSTSHLALMQNWLLARGETLPSPDSPEMILFDLVVHVGTLVSIAVVFRHSLAKFISYTWKGVQGHFTAEQSNTGKLYIRLTLLGLLSVLVTGLIGFPMKAYLESVFAQPYIMSLSLIVTGILLWWTDGLEDRKIGLRELGIWIAVIIGIGQGLALLPGLSRSGLTIAFALFAGLQRRWAAEYSFFIAFPTILGATLLQAIEVMTATEPMTLSLTVILTGFVVAALVGIVALRLVLTLLYQARFRFFSFYTWALAIVVAVSSYHGFL